MSDYRRRDWNGPYESEDRGEEDVGEHLYEARPFIRPLGDDTPLYKRQEDEAWADPPLYSRFTPNEPEPPLVPVGEDYSKRNWYSEDAFEQPRTVGSGYDQEPAAYYSRPESSEDQFAVSREEMTFAPPPKFGKPGFSWDLPEEEQAAPARQSNVYSPRQASWAETARMQTSSLYGTQYQVEPNYEAAPKKRRGKRRGKGIFIGVLVLALLGGGAYLGRDWVMQQIARLTGSQQVAADALPQDAKPESPMKGYDPAPASKLSPKAEKGISAVSGAMTLEHVAVTTNNVVERVPLADGTFDYYLFAAADGRLLGYYEGLGVQDFIVQPGDTFYVRQPPYLLSNQGKALVKSVVYQQAAGKDALLWPLENGWAMLSDRAQTKFNFINKEGALLSKLWFCRAVPFYGEYTLAYVDTGNMAKPQERYALYALGKDGAMNLWRHAPDTTDLVDAACGLALMQSGDLVRISDQSVLCTADSVAAYLDSEAVVARDRSTGKLGLFVKGEQHYDFAYDQMAPVASELHWQESGTGAFVKYAVSQAQYPQPLSHYFALTKEGGQEYVALSTRSCCPVLLDGPIPQ